MDLDSFLFPICVLLGIVIFIVGIVVALVLVTKKKIWLGLLIGIPLLCLGCSVVTGAAFWWWDSDTYVPDDLSDVDVDTDEDYVYDDYDTDDVVGDSGGKVDGYAVNNEYGFTTYVGDYDDGVFASSSVTGATESLSYCVPTDDLELSGGLCESGYFPIFDITVMTWDQWSEYISVDSMGIDVYTKVGDDAEYVYLFSHPNGIYPSDLPIPEDYFDAVIVSFMTSE